MSSNDTPTITSNSSGYTDVLRRHRLHWRDRVSRDASLGSILAFAFSLVIQYYAIAYATASASNPSTDIVLSNVPIVNVDAVYVYGLMLLIAFITFLCLTYPRRTPFILYSLALFIVIRSFFNTLTHMAPYPIPLDPDFGTTMTKIFFGSDLFFSGHTGSPFLMALMFWQQKSLRYIFLAWSVFFGAIVLLGHLHYTIDVAAAFFITYGIYDMAKWFFARSYELFTSDPVPATLRIVS